MARAIPPLPIDPEGHVADLRNHYQAAIDAAPTSSPDILPERRADFVLAQRESTRRALRDATGRSDPN